MKCRYWCLLSAIAIVGACTPSPSVQPTGDIPVRDQQFYPNGNSFRLLAANELPIVATTVDSQASSLGKERITDGDLATQWASGTYRASDAWVSFELAAMANLTSVALKTGPSKAGTSYDIQVSTDGVNWSTALPNQANTTWNLETKPFPSPVQGRFVRLLWHNNPTAPDSRFSVFEAVVNGQPNTETSPSPTATESPIPTETPSAAVPSPAPTPEELPPSAEASLPPSQEPTPTPPPAGDPGPLVRLVATQASASSSYASLAPSRAIDGNQSTQWGSDRYQASEEWLVLSFDTTAVFEQLRIKTGALPPGVMYQVEVSDDGLTWRAASGSLTNTTWNLETMSISGQGRFLRLRFSNNPSAPMSRFYVFELEVLGRVLGGAPSPVPTTAASPTPELTPTPPVPTGAPSPSELPPSPTAAPAAGPLAPRLLRRLSTPGSAIASSGTAGMAVDGVPGTAWSPSASSPQWIAVPLADHPSDSTLLVAWDSTAYHYTNANAAPRSYDIQVSNDSTDGRDGTWTLAKQVVDNPLRSRIDTIDAPNARWVRVLIRSIWSYGPQLRELTVYGSAAGDRLNTWLFIGDSITALTFDPSQPNDFPGTVEAHVPGFRPLVVAGGTGGDTAELGQQKLAQGLSLCPPGSFVGLSFGTNDATRGVAIATYKAQMQQMIDAIKSSGRTPMIARTSWDLNSNLPKFVQAEDELTASNHLPPGPDLYSYFKAHPEQLRDDKVHPTVEGEQAIQRLWGEAISAAYLRP